jgi:hypothetical protein
MNAIVNHDELSSSVKIIDGNVVPFRGVGFYTDISNEDYHSGAGVSKSGLWTIHNSTPAHFRFPPVKEETTQSKAIKDMGTATHLAILEPDEFEKRAFRGPEDRRGLKWKDAEEHCKKEGKLLLVESAFDKALKIRDAVHRNAWINAILTRGQGVNEASAYANDPVTGQVIRCRPDRYREDLNVIIDIKTTESAHPEKFARSVVNYGYHAQDAFYTDIMESLGKPVNAFVFIAFEKDSPYATAVYELPPAMVEEGRSIMRKALDTYHDCMTRDHWPAYDNDVVELSFKRWAYTMTPPPEDEQAAA